MEFLRKKEKEEEKSKANKKIGPMLAASIALGAAGAPEAKAGQDPIFPEHHYHWQTNDPTKIPPDIQQKMNEDRLRDYGITPEKLKKVQGEIDQKIEREKRELLGE